MTGQKTVPNVFINKTHIGGCDKTMQVRNKCVCLTDCLDRILCFCAQNLVSNAALCLQCMIAVKCYWLVRVYKQACLTKVTFEVQLNRFLFALKKNYS